MAAVLECSPTKTIMDKCGQTDPLKPTDPPTPTDPPMDYDLLIAVALPILPPAITV